MASEQLIEEQLLAVTPIDGRYADKTSELSGITSEFGLIRYRVAVEAGWLGVLGSGVLPDVPRFSDRTLDYLNKVPEKFDVRDAIRVKAIEKTLNHDVKAVEMWLRSDLEANDLGEILELVHFGCTSEDITNLAYAMMYRDARDKVLLPGIKAIGSDLETKAERYAAVPMLAHTHGQAATPTTMGKEFAVFADRVNRAGRRLGKVSIYGKFNGATGNFSAVNVAYANVNWPNLSGKFIRSLGFEVSPVTTQIEPHDWMATFFDELKHGNTILTDVSQDMWQYIAMHYLTQKVIAGEVGSSTMPHKVNPIDFENAEGNFGVANALLEFMSRKLPISRMQRDLSDSTVLRSSGTAFGHTLVGLKSLQKGLGKVHPNEQRMREELDSEWSILTEALQTVMRRYRIPNSYDVIKQASRGQAFGKEDYLAIVEALEIPTRAKRSLRDLTPSSYLGLAVEIANGTI